MPSLHALVVATLTLDTALLALLVWAYHAPRFASHRIGGGPPMRVTWPHRLRTMSVTSTLSLATVFGVTYGLHDSLLHTRDTSWWAIAGQTLAILFLYDLVYYFLHRAMHHPKLLRSVHGMHHRARNPSALESFYGSSAKLVVARVAGAAPVTALAVRDRAGVPNDDRRAGRRSRHAALRCGTGSPSARKRRTPSASRTGFAVMKRSLRSR